MMIEDITQAKRLLTRVKSRRFLELLRKKNKLIFTFFFLPLSKIQKREKKGQRKSTPTIIMYVRFTAANENTL